MCTIYCFGSPPFQSDTTAILQISDILIFVKMAGNTYNTRATTRAQNVGSTDQDNSVVHPSQAAIPQGLIENPDFQRYVATLLAENGRMEQVFAPNKCMQCIQVRGELSYRLEKLEQGQTRLECTIEKLNGQLQEAVCNIDTRLKALEPNDENFSSFAPNNGNFNLVNFPVPPGFHLSPNRPLRTENRYSGVKYHNAGNFHKSQ